MSYVSFNRRQYQLLTLADFLEKLPPEEFDLETWCTPAMERPHMCNTTACIGGWAVILHGNGRAYLEGIEALNKIREKRDKQGWFGRKFGPNYDDMIDVVANVVYSSIPNWAAEAQKLLEISDNETEIFLPSSTVWVGDSHVTNQMAANALRFMAFNPVPDTITGIDPISDDAIGDGISNESLPECWLDKPYNEEEILAFLASSSDYAGWRDYVDDPINTEDLE